MNDHQHLPSQYHAIADNYAAVVDSKPHNAFYERPATLALLHAVARAMAELGDGHACG